MDVEVALQLWKVQKVEGVMLPGERSRNGVCEWLICIRGGEGSARECGVLRQKLTWAAETGSKWPGI
jgi:hypothetical protein